MGFANTLFWIVFSIFIILNIGILLFAIVKSGKRKKRRAPDYFSFFIVSVVFAVIFWLIDGMTNIMFIIFVIFAIVCLTHVKSWKRNRRHWNQFEKWEKRVIIWWLTAFILFIILAIIFLYGAGILQ